MSCDGHAILVCVFRRYETFLPCGVVFTFFGFLHHTALEDRIHKISMKQLKGKFIKAISWKTSPCICIRNITEHYEEEFLKHYFENTKRSGGSEVISVDMFGNGEAKVMFKDIKGIFIVDVSCLVLYLILDTIAILCVCVLVHFAQINVESCFIQNQTMIVQ